jgi:acetylornithine deacetylase/succinyl-diaminopimelate desuccinylase-like protein
MNATELLKKLVSVPSVFPSENTISKYLNSLLSGYGFSVRTMDTDGRENIIATYGKAKRYLCLQGHMDTVPPNTGMAEPYKLKGKHGLGIGLGAADMKGGVAAIVTAAKTAVNQGLPLKIVLTVGEENIFEGSNTIINSKALEDVDFLISGESGGESGDSKSAKEPFNVCYGRKGRILFDATISGRRSHAARKQDGINAILKSSEFVYGVERMQFPKHKHLGNTDIVVQSISGKADSFSVPDKCAIEFSVITAPNIKSRVVLDKLSNLCKEKGIEAEIKIHKRLTPYAESYEVNRSNPFLRKLEKNLFIPNGIKPLYAASVADENVFANGLHIPVIGMGPVSGGFHSVNEWVNLKSLEATTKAYEKAIALYYS